MDARLEFHDFSCRFFRARGRPIRRVLSWTVIYLDAALPRSSSNLPDASASSVNGICLVLLRTRFTERSRSPGLLVVSYTTVSPLPLRAVCFLWHCLAGYPGWVLPTILLCGARTFLGTFR